MSDDVVRIVLLTIMGLTAASTLSFPLFFSRYNWRKTSIGRALMTKSASTAGAVTVTFLMNVWRPPEPVRLTVYAVCFLAIAISSLRLTKTMLSINDADRMVAPKREEVTK